MTIAKEFAAKASVAVVAAAMVLGMFASAAKAQTTDDLQQMINDLLAQVSSLQGQLGQEGAASAATGVCPYTWTRDLASGATGADVMKLQQFLNADPDTRVAVEGAGSPGMETEYYGPATAAAVSKMQVKYRADILSPANLVNPTGYFGPSSRAKANALCVAAPAEPETPVVDGEEGEEATDEEEEDVELSGEASFKSAELDGEESSLEEGEEDVAIANYTVEFENGDAEISRVDVSLVAGTADEVDPWDVFETVSLWVDGDKIAEATADDQDEYLDEDSGELRFSSLGLTAMEDEEVEITIAVTLQGNLDGVVDGEEWELDVTSMRWFDADGVAETETDSTIGVSAVSFDIEEAGANEEVKVSLSSSNPDSADVIVDTDSDTNDVTVLVANLEAEDNDIELNTVVVSVEVDTSATTTDITDVLEDVYVVIDGQSFTAEAIGTEDDYDEATDDDTPAGSTGITEGYSERATATTTVWYYFDIDGDVTLAQDEKTEMEVVVDINDTDDGDRYPNGATVKAEVTSVETGVWDAEGAEDIDNFSGSAVGDEHTLIADGIYVPVDGFDFEISKVDADGKIYQYKVDFEVTAVEGDYYIDENAAAASSSPTTGVVYTVDPATSGITDLLTSTADEDSTSGAFVVREGETETFTLTVTVDPEAAGTFRVQLDEVYWTTDSDGVTGVEAYELTPTTDFRTDAQSIAA